MDSESQNSVSAGDRMKSYLERIATGPRMSKDLSREEAEDGLSLILGGEVSSVRAAVFLIATRMKLETLEENIGFWRALDRTTVKQSVNLDTLLQVADPFDGFTRTPYFGFFVLPVLSLMGLPAYGFSSLPLAPKFGITFEAILQDVYKLPASDSARQRVALIEEFRFGYLSTRHAHPSLEQLRTLRTEIVKRTMLSTFEKMLMPLQAAAGGNYLATTYFHRGYEVPMMEIARMSPYDQTLVGNGMEGTTLFGVHKPARLFILKKGNPVRETNLDFKATFSSPSMDEIAAAHDALRKQTATLGELCNLGEEALKQNQGPAAPLIACQCATFAHLFGIVPSLPEGYDAAKNILHRGTAYTLLMAYLEKARVLT